MPCGLADPARTAAAALNVPIPAAFHVNTGFDSVWVSDRANNQVNRVDPDTGEIEAVIDVGIDPYRLQPADGRMVVRTADAYEFIDPATNTVTATLLKSDVGPAANRAWAVDGALWICDGQRLHRYDPTTLEQVASIELGFDCGFVHATDDIVIAWTYNEDPGQSGTPTSPRSSTRRPTASSDDRPSRSTSACRRSSTTWSSSPGLKGRHPSSSTRRPARSCRHPISVGPTSTPTTWRSTAPTCTSWSRAATSPSSTPTTFEIVDTIEPMDFDPPLGVQINAIALTPGALWVVNDESSILQRFDRPT